MTKNTMAKMTRKASCEEEEEKKKSYISYHSCHYRKVLSV